MIQSILIDSKEPQWVKELNFNAPCMVCELGAGDAWVIAGDGAKLVIERKTPRDFLESIKDRRLFNQAARMREESVWCYVVITGAILPDSKGKATIQGETHDLQQTGWEYAAVEGAKVSLAELGVYPLHCDGDRDYMPCIVRLAARSRDSMPVLPVRQATLFGGAESVLASLPGIGPKKALAILEKLPHLGIALEWLTTPGEFEPRIEGIGPITKQNICDLMGGSLSLNLNGGNSNE